MNVWEFAHAHPVAATIMVLGASWGLAIFGMGMGRIGGHRERKD